MLSLQKAEKVYKKELLSQKKNEFISDFSIHLVF